MVIIPLIPIFGRVSMKYYKLFVEKCGYCLFNKNNHSFYANERQNVFIKRWVPDSTYSSVENKIVLELLYGRSNVY